jgi:hypothetical protein
VNDEPGIPRTAAAIPGLEPAFDVEVLLGSIEDHGLTRRGRLRHR